MYPFDFRVVTSLKDRLRRRLLYACTILALIAVFAAGFLTVYVNSCSIIYPEPIKVFGAYRDGDTAGFIFLGHFYEL